MSLPRMLIVGLAVAALAACGPDEKKSDNNTTGNTTSNNTTANNTTGNTTSNNTTANNTTGNTTSNNTTANNTTGTNNDTPPMCVEPEVECFQNTDCADDQRCEGSSAEEDLSGCCVVGPRGDGMTGDECMEEADCASGICISRNDDPAICSEECDGPDTCPGDLECHPVLALCVTPSDM